MLHGMQPAPPHWDTSDALPAAGLLQADNKQKLQQEGGSEPCAAAPAEGLK